MLGETFHGDTAAIWLSGDGSYGVYRRSTGQWTAPAGETARLSTLSSADSGAAYVLYLETGARIGFGADGWQVWTADLAGNRTMYQYSGSRLSSITDPAGKLLRFFYDSGSQVSRIAVQASGTSSDTTTVATLTYVGSANAAKLGSFKLWRDSLAGDVTRFTYRNTTFGAFVDSIVDPRSAAGAVVATQFSYDTLYTPTGFTGPHDRYGVTQAFYRDVWRRAVPRAGYGRLPADSLERLPYPNQVRGTMIDLAGHATEARVDPFGGPVWVRTIAAEANIGGFSVPSSAADDIRDIERDSAGRVTKVVRARNIAELADSVIYSYDALGRVTTVVKPTARYPVPAVGAGARTDTTSFTYDSVSVVSGGAWCSRLRTMSDSVGSATTIQYGASGVAACLPSRTIGLAGDTTTFTYGSLAVGDVAGVRPVTIRDANGVVDSVAYDAATWNTIASIRTGGAATRVYLNRLGRPDSLVDPMGVRTRLIANRLGWPLLAKAGRGDTVLTSRTSYLAGGLVSQTELYVSSDAELDTPTGTVQATHTYYNLLGQVDSTTGPGDRSATDSTRARKQSWSRDRGGNPLYSYSGNGSAVTRTYDWQGRVASLNASQVWSGLSLDREPFAAPSTRSRYEALPLTMGRNLNAGAQYQYVYDALGRITATTSRDAYFGLTHPQTTHLFGYSRRGALTGDTLVFDDGTSVRRSYEYNRRGQRTLVSDDVIQGAGTFLVGDAGATTRYYYNAFARLDSMVATTRRPGAPDSVLARVKWLYDRGGRDTLRAVRAGPSGAGGAEIATRFHYDALGRTDVIAATQGGTTRYSFGSPTRDSVDNLRTYTEQRRTATLNYTNTFSHDGAGRLLAAAAGTGQVSNTWGYDAFGNRRAESLVRGDGSCSGATTLDYGVDNRLYVRHSSACHPYARYWTDQAGNRLAETDSTSTGAAGVQSELTYTALNQLYFSATPTAAPGTWDFNWHWYDPQGLRVMTWVASGNNIVTPRPDSSWTLRNYYVYDGSDVALTLVKSGDTWRIQQRYLMGGVDEPLATRVWTGDATLQESLILVPDRQGATVTAIKMNGTEECRVPYANRGAFGAVDAATSPCGSGISVATGYTGASTPNGAGGYTYLRNRWYDPQTGRFLTQDPIGLAGGANLYAYAGNNPVTFTDPFGLCEKEKWWCKAFTWVKGQVEAHPALVNAIAIGIYAASEAPDGDPAEVEEIEESVVEGQALAKLGSSSPDFIAPSKGVAVPVPTGATGPKPTDASGMMFKDGEGGGRGMSPKVTGVRIMDANKTQPRRAVYMNDPGQTVSPRTGKPVSNDDPEAHHYF